MLVAVRAAGVQPFDAAVRAGWTPPGYSGGFPRIPGNEFAGVVEAVGAGVDWEVGAEVLGFSLLNSYATHIVVPAGDVTAKPAGVPWEVAGALTAAVQTAEIAVDHLRPAAGETLLIHGAAGAVGTAAVQIALWRGATVIGTAQPANHDYLRSLGALPVAYGPGLSDRVRALAPGGVSAALDGAGGEALEVSLSLVADRGRVLTLVEHGKAGSLGVMVTQGTRTAERLGRYAGLYAKGELRFLIRRTYGLEEAAQAHREIETGHGRGKLALVI
ncbi:NADP-dependent oxidoreductase [Nonomuraea rhizosphaerae]|uniref:NADP-dependent oxidoreductase n=1 Tax=Nonomuraea rhizosphaerae TaxID=2665663 RepID=UPI0027E3915A|nr:NADP-dependent oxidoreductase [Nonomuraea rhizosphaerae]